MSTFKPINIGLLITANHSAPSPYLCAQINGYISLADETVVFYLQTVRYLIGCLSQRNAMTERDNTPSCR